MVTKFQFELVMKLLASGVNNYVDIRQKAGLTAGELDEIIRDSNYYAKYFADQERMTELEEAKSKKKHWWKK